MGHVEALTVCDNAYGIIRFERADKNYENKRPGQLPYRARTDRPAGALSARAKAIGVDIHHREMGLGAGRLTDGLVT